MACLCLYVQVEADRQQLLEKVEKQVQDHKANMLALEEKSKDAENQIKDLKETIFELEDQVEQQRAVRLHTNQTILDLESMTIICLPVCLWLSIYHLAKELCHMSCVCLTAILQPMVNILHHLAESGLHTHWLESAVISKTH